MKISYFDAYGKIATRLAVKNETVKEGEALEVDFIETRDLNISKVYGAVLKDYEIKTNSPVSIKEVLKGGAVLTPNAHYQFALINGKDVKAINLNEALADEDIILPPGSDLLIFNKAEYLSLVSENPNMSLNPLSSILSRAKNIAEIYLDGIRIAYVPVNKNYTFSESISNFYIPGPKTIFDIAIIENNSVVEAFDLKTEIGNLGRRKLDNGDRLFIFEDKFYDALIKNIISDGKLEITPLASLSSDNVEVILLQKQLQDERDEYLEALSNSRRILQQANLINIRLDGELFTYLPYVKGVTSSYALKKLKNRLPKLVTEFAAIQNTNTGKSVKIKTLTDPFEIKQGEELNFISSNNYRLAVKSYDDEIETNLLAELKSSDAVKIYYDGRLVLLLPPNYRPAELKLFDQYAKNSDLYKLYVGLNTKSSKNGTWDLLTFESEEFFADSNSLILGPSNVVNLFSNNFIRKEFINDKANINGVNFNINTYANPQDKIVNQDNIINSENNTTPDSNLIDNMLTEENSDYKQSEHLNTQIEIMKNSLRTISGSILVPRCLPCC